ncbi:MAG: NADH-quinone oxidoreductase subunit N [Ferruginibacter sp.]|nr:NADH-quinone oxidoreductase subunit N [Cytophagales bacterium]
MLAIILLSVFGIACLFLGFLDSKRVLMPAALLFLAVAFVANAREWNHPASYLNAMMANSNVSVAFSGIIILSALLILPLSERYLADERAQLAEYYAILLFSIVGAVMMVSFENMIMLFIGLEILSVSMYVLTGSDKRNLKSNEAALKYFLMGAFATGILLFGIALVYGATGTFTLGGVGSYVTGNAGAISPLLYLGLMLMLIGILFKVSAAPFHFWTPDVYDGAPSFFTAFMSTVVKTAGFAALYRLLAVAFTDVYSFWWITVAVITVMTLAAGNLTAVYQQSFKRMLAYSSISHAGYLLIAVVAFNQKSEEAILFYSLAYSLATVTAFGILMLVADQNGTEGRPNEDYSAFNGLARSNPFLAFALTVSMCSLAGIPLTSGFFGKFFVFISAIEQQMVWLLVIAVLMSAVGIYYYFRVVIAMYMREGNTGVIAVNPLYRFVLIVTTVLTLLLGILPGMITEMDYGGGSKALGKEKKDQTAAGKRMEMTGKAPRKMYNRL